MFASQLAPLSFEEHIPRRFIPCIGKLERKIDRSLREWLAPGHKTLARLVHTNACRDFVSSLPGLDQRRLQTFQAGGVVVVVVVVVDENRKRPRP
jgi:hypothetical protein